MHELGICRRVIEAATAALPSPSGQTPRVVRVTVEVGRLSGLTPESLRRCFQLLAPGTPLEGATLVVDEPPIRGRCADCGDEFEIEALAFACPACGSQAVALCAGPALRVVSLETGEPTPLGDHDAPTGTEGR